MANTFDPLILELLNDSEKMDSYLDSFSDNPNAGCKKYQTFIDEERKIGFIISKHVSIIGMYENTNPNLGRLIGESDILVNNLGGKEVEAYNSFDIKVYGVLNHNPHRNLGKLFLFSQGTALLPGQEAHHKLHAILNASSIVLAVPKKENASKYQELSTTQALEYIRTDILGFDDATYERYSNNIFLLCNCYKKRRGIYVNGIDLASACLDASMVNDIKVGLSKY